MSATPVELTLKSKEKTSWPCGNEKWNMFFWGMMTAGVVMILTLLLAYFFHTIERYRYVTIYDCSGEAFKADDGDSLYCNGKFVRIAGIDAPETQHPKHGISEDQESGPEAAAYATRIFQNAKTITVLAFETDKYDRELAHILVNGELFAPKMIEAGFAYETISEYGDQGFAGYGALIMKAWDETQYRPEFENPHDWREKNQKKD